jgi:hypothetical protein
MPNLKKISSVLNDVKGQIGGYFDEAKPAVSGFLNDMGNKAESYVGDLGGDKAVGMMDSAKSARKKMDITASEYIKQKKGAEKVADLTQKHSGLANIGAQSGLVGAGIGAVSGLMSDDQSMLGGAMMGAVGGAGLGAGSKALGSGKLAKAEMRAGARGRRLRNIEANMPAKSSSENPATRLKEDRASGYVKANGNKTRETSKLASEEANVAGLTRTTNPYVTGGLAAGGSLAYATLASNRS